MQRINTFSITICFYIISLVPVSGQQTYLSGNYGGPGTQYLYSRHNVGFTNDDIIAHGPGTTWDVSDLPASTLDLWEIKSRNEEIDGITFSLLCGLSGLDGLTCFNIYNNTQQAWIQTDTQTLIQYNLTDIKSFQRKTTDYLLETFFGFTIDFNGSPLTAVIVYPTPDTILHFPMTYNDSLSSKVTWHIDLAPTGQNIQYTSHQHRTSKVDGWGTLITPYDTLQNVLRVRAVVARNDTLVTDTLTVPIMINQVEYTWYDTTYGLPVMIANGFLVDTLETVAAINYLVDAECEQPTWSVGTDTTVYFLDGDGNASVDFNIDQSNAQVYTWNFGDGTIDVSDGDIAHTYTSPGLYNVIVEGCMTNCLPLNSCSSDTIQIEVRDTTSAVFTPDPSAVGIHLYPNPASGSISLDIPKTLQGDISYQFLDLVGNRVLEGKAKAGVSQIDIRNIPDGMYFIWISDPMTKTRYAAVPVVVAQ